MKSRTLALCLFLGFCAGRLGAAEETYQPKEGDLVFESLPHNALVDTIEGSTGSPFSHCGVLHKTGDAWVVIEAIGPVKETALAAWIAQGRDGRMSVYRLKAAYAPKIAAFIVAAQSYEGLPYDIHYSMDDAAIYCSELIYKAFLKATGEEMGKLQTLGELRWQPYENVIRQIEGGGLPLDRKMITPRSLSEAKQVEKIYSR